MNNKTVPFIIIISLITLALCTAFSFKLDPTKTGGYYQLLSDAFLKKKLALLIPPDPQLLTLTNPYDPIQNALYRIHDISFFNGRYYLYWGPIPALVRIILGNRLPEQFFICLYVTVSSLCFYFICKYLKDKYFQNFSNLVFSFVILSGCFNGAVINLLVGSGIYYEAIAAAQAFFLISLILTLFYFDKQEKKFIFFFSIFSFLSFGSRISFILPCTFLAITIFFNQISILLKKNHPFNFSRIFSFLISFSPYIIGLSLLGLYNYLRFDNFFEFGLRYQLAGINMFDTYTSNFSLHNLPPNIKNYFLNMPNTINHLPFITTDILHYPNIERLVFSVFLISPITILTIIVHNHTIRLDKLKNIFLITIFLVLVSISLFSPISATRYIFDFIYLLNITGFLFLGSYLSSSSAKKYKNLVFFSLTPLIIISLYSSISMYLYGLREYHYQAYFNINSFLYHTLNKPSLIDKDYYLDLKTVNNQTKYLIINDRNNSLFGVSTIPKEGQKFFYTKIQSRPLVLRLTSFEPNSVIVTLTFIVNNDPKIKKDILTITYGQQNKQFFLNNKTTISIPLNIKTGFNEITLESENVKKDPSSPPIELTNFMLLPSSP